MERLIDSKSFFPGSLFSYVSASISLTLFAYCTACVIFSPSAVAAEAIGIGPRSLSGQSFTNMAQSQIMISGREKLVGAYSSDMKLIDDKLKTDPNNTEWLYKKAAIYADLEDYSNALIILHKIVVLDPKNSKANALIAKINYIKCLEPKNEIGFDQDEAYVSDIKHYWSYSSLHYYRFTDIGTYGARVNAANRFGQLAEQYQLEAYPTFQKGVSAALSFAYANNSQIVFPQYQYTVEPYFSLPRNFEVSIGQRFIKSVGVKIYDYTGSVGYYFGNNFAWVRPYHYTPKSSSLFELGLQHYFDNRDTYVTAKVATGKAPDIADLAPLNQIIILKTNLIALSGQWPVTKTIFLRAGASYTRQVFPSDRVRDITDGTVGVIWRF